MIIEALYRAISLDLAWFVSLAMSNLLWVFIFYAAANILDESNTISGSIALFLIFTFDLFTELTFFSITGWVFLGTGFLALLYITRVALSLWVENTPSLRKHLLKILTVHWLAIFVIYNVFLV